MITVIISDKSLYYAKLQTQSSSDMTKVIFAIFSLLIFTGCTTENTFFHLSEARGTLDNQEINEASGLTTSVVNEGMLWTHNDSGDKARIFLIDEYGKSKAEYSLVGINNRDWEDIASGPGPEDDQHYLYIGEIGDNLAQYNDKYIYRLKEPKWGTDGPTITEFDTISFKFPDGTRDAETLMVDPLTKDLYILSKREENIRIYRASYPQSTTGIITLEKLGTIPYFNTVSADITSDGKEILLKTYDNIYYWPRKDGNSITQTLISEPVVIPYNPEPQGEAIAWKKDGSGFFTLSEESRNTKPVLYFYKKK